MSNGKIYYQKNKRGVDPKYKIYYYKNRKKKLEQMRIYREKNRERIRKKNRQWQRDNPEKMRESVRQWREKNREEMSESGKKYYRNNIEKVKERQRKYRINNRDIRRKNWKKRYENDLKFNINSKVKKRIKESLKKTKYIRNRKDGRQWEAIVGYTVNALIKRLKKTMPEGYAWKDFLNGGLHIDHIIPKSVYNFDRVENPDFKRCWALSNLRLLPAKENMIKKDRIDKPFQLGLKILEK